jgi:energy-converting hydrogenase Eha subunit B
VSLQWGGVLWNVVVYVFESFCCSPLFAGETKHVCLKVIVNIISSLVVRREKVLHKHEKMPLWLFKLTEINKVRCWTQVQENESPTIPT